MGARSLIALLTTFLVTVGVLGGIGYAVTQIALSPRRDVFRAGFFEFDLAQGWWCEPDDSEYVCTPPGNPPHAAIAVIAMKERNDKDTLEAYEEHLRQPQRAGSDEGKPGQLSEIRFVNRRTIGTHEWIEALHSGSEIPHFDTYYLGTTTSLLGILVTMSVHKDHSAKYIGQMNEMMRTLTVYQR